jgi:hypothetical protein
MVFPLGHPILLLALLVLILALLVRNPFSHKVFT